MFFSSRGAFALASILFLASSVAVRSQEDSFQTRDVITGLYTPWEILWGPDGWLWITERPGLVSRVDPITGKIVRLLDLRDTIWERAESGMLGLALHPEFEHRPEVFLVYTYARGSDTVIERLVRYRYDAGQDTLIEPTVLLDSIPAAIFRVGSRLLITPDRRLFMTTGDGARTALSQDRTSPVGKVLRIGLDGTVPADNPYADAPWPASLVWTAGHRNPQGLTQGPHGILYVSEHGHDDEDEVNLLRPGRNYGWPNVHGYCDDSVDGKRDTNESKFCADSNVVEPLRSWTPTIGPASLHYYDHNVIPTWRRSLLLLTLGKAKPELPPQAYALVVMQLSPEGDRVISESSYFEKRWGRLRAMCIAPDGRIFIGTSNNDGRGTPAPDDDRIIEIRRALSDVPETPEHEVARIVPSPVLDESVVTLDSELGRGRVTIVDAFGRTVRTGEFEGGDRYRLLRGDLPAGVYQIEIRDDVRSVRLRALFR